jgi:maltooligosyltrehalose trehalohydrolase
MARLVSSVHEDPELAQAVCDGRRAEFAAFGWQPEAIPDPQDAATFARSILDWREREPHAGLFARHRRLIRLRRMIPALADGRMDQVRVCYDEHARWLTLERRPATVSCNLAAQAQEVSIPQGQPARVLLPSEAGIRVGPSALTLPPDAVVILGAEEHRDLAGTRP